MRLDLGPWRPEHPQERAEREQQARLAVAIEAYNRQSEERLRRRRSYMQTHRVWIGDTDCCADCGLSRVAIHFHEAPCMADDTLTPEEQMRASHALAGRVLHRHELQRDVLHQLREAIHQARMALRREDIRTARAILEDVSEL